MLMFLNVTTGFIYFGRKAYIELRQATCIACEGLEVVAQILCFNTRRSVPVELGIRSRKLKEVRTHDVNYFAVVVM